MKSKFNTCLTDIELLGYYQTINTKNRYIKLIEYKKFYSPLDTGVNKGVPDKKEAIKDLDEQAIKNLGLETAMNNIDQIIKVLTDKYGDALNDDLGNLNKLEMLHNILLGEITALTKWAIMPILEERKKALDDNIVNKIQTGIYTKAFDGFMPGDNKDLSKDPSLISTDFFKSFAELDKILANTEQEKNEYKKIEEDATILAKQIAAAIKIQAAARGYISRKNSKPMKGGMQLLALLIPMLVVLATSTMGSASTVLPVDAGVVVPPTVSTVMVPNSGPTAYVPIGGPTGDPDGNQVVSSVPQAQQRIGGPKGSSPYIDNTNMKLVTDFMISDYTQGKSYELTVKNADGKWTQLTINADGNLDTPQFLEVESHAGYDANNIKPFQKEQLEEIVQSGMKSLHTFVDGANKNPEFITELETEISNSPVFSLISKESRPAIVTNLLEYAHQKNPDFNPSLADKTKIALDAQLTTQKKIDTLPPNQRKDNILALLGETQYGEIENAEIKAELIQFAQENNLDIVFTPGITNLVASQKFTGQKKIFKQKVSTKQIKSKKMMVLFDTLIMPDVIAPVEGGPPADGQGALDIIRQVIKAETLKSIDMITLRGRFEAYTETMTFKETPTGETHQGEKTMVVSSMGENPIDNVILQIYAAFDRSVSSEILNQVKYYNENVDESIKMGRELLESVFDVLDTIIPTGDEVTKEESGFFSNYHVVQKREQNELLEEMSQIYAHDSRDFTKKQQST